MKGKRVSHRILMTREISVADKFLFYLKSLTLLIKVFRLLYFPAFWVALIPCFWNSFRRLF